MGALMSEARAVFSTRSSVPALISTIYQHHELHFAHLRDTPLHQMMSASSKFYMHKLNHDVQK